MDEDCIAYTNDISVVTALLNGKWTLQVLCAMRNGPVRLGQLKRITPIASKKALTASLRALEVSGFVVRRDMSDAVLRVEYSFSPERRELICDLLDTMAKWGATLKRT